MHASRVQATVPSGLHRHELHPSPAGHIRPTGHTLPLGSLHCGGPASELSHGPRQRYERGGQVELPKNVIPSHPQKVAMSSVHGRPSAGPQ